MELGLFMQVKFKTTKIADEFEELISGEQGSPLLLPLALAAAAIIQEETGKPATITEIWRPAGLYGYASVHEFGRGVDFRSKDMTDEQIKRVCDRVNQTFFYMAADGRPRNALALHTKGTEQHLHGMVPAAKTWRT